MLRPQGLRVPKRGGSPSADSIRTRNRSGTELGEDFPLVGEDAGLQLGIDGASVDGQLKAAPRRGNQFEPVYFLFQFAKNSARQTDGLGLVVSHRAVAKGDIHGYMTSRQSG